MKSKAQIILPTLNNRGGNLSKQWYIQFSFRNPINGEMERQKVYKGVNEGKTVEERTTAAKKVLYYYTRKIKRGWTIFDDDKTISMPMDDNLSILTVSNVAMQRALDQLIIKQKPKTIDGYRRFLRYFIDYLEEVKKHRYLHQINQETVTAFDRMMRNKYSNKTRNDCFFLLKMVFNQLISTKHLKDNPFKKCEMLENMSVPFRYYQPNIALKIQAILEEADPQLFFFVQMVYYTTLRVDELRNLQIKHIDLFSGTITVTAKISKNDKQRVVAIPDQLSQILIEKKINTYPETYYLFSINHKPGENPCHGNYFNKRFHKLKTLHKIPAEYKIYGFKPTAAVNLAIAGAQVYEIQKHLRHSTIAATQIYMEQYRPVDSVMIRNKYPTIFTLPPEDSSI